MCGIAGFAGIVQPGLLDNMCARLRHRGPDSGGAVETVGLFGLGMRRLAIIDLQTGEQPMQAEDGKVTLVFNGEIYNYRELREDLRANGFSFRTNSDTEVVLTAYLAWGSDAWSRLHGMFAIAIFDARPPEPVLRLVRDRVGIKPLYYIHAGSRLIFASEIKALMAWDGFDRSISLQAISDYLALRYVPGPSGLFSHVHKAPPASELTFRGGVLTSQRFWQPPAASSARPAMDEREAVAVFGEALRSAVRRHMVSDVPVGAFLSGGIDSNVIVALMAEANSAPINTFSVGFMAKGDPDLDRAALSAKMLGTRHHSILCTPADFAALPDIIYALDEPVGDPIVVPMAVLAREARRSVTVALSGEGADELLGGYMFHRKILQLDKLRRMVPSALWPTAAALIEAVPAGLLNRAFDYPGQLGEEGRSKIARLLRSVPADDLGGLYRTAITLFDAEDRRAAGLPHRPDCAMPIIAQGSVLQRLVGMQYDHWLPDDILMKSDKITMAASLEGRVPFMDDLVISAAAALPDNMKFRHGTNKWALRAFAATLLPPQIAQAPKRAFYAPLDGAMEAPLMRDMVGAMLDPVRLGRRGLINPAYVAALQGAGPAGGFLVQRRLFALLALELWFERFAPEACFR